MLVQMDPGKYGHSVVYGKVKKVLYLEVLQAIYGMLQSALLSYINMGNIWIQTALKFTHMNHVWLTRSWRESHYQ